MVTKYQTVAVGGTFDMLHKGHIKLIKKALAIGSTLIIGLTTDEMLQTFKKTHSIAKFDERKASLLNLFRCIKALHRVQIVPLNDPHGIDILRKDVEALLVSEETVQRGEEINTIRKTLNLQPLKLVVLHTVLADDGYPISSTRIRLGEIDRNGHLLPSVKQPLPDS